MVSSNCIPTTLKELNIIPTHEQIEEMAEKAADTGMVSLADLCSSKRMILFKFIKWLYKYEEDIRK
ncbi:MAG: hypothetical protein ACLRHW_12625 [Coprobacillus cateniformis]